MIRMLIWKYSFSVKYYFNLDNKLCIERLSSQSNRQKSHNLHSLEDLNIGNIGNTAKYSNFEYLNKELKSDLASIMSKK